MRGHVATDLSGEWRPTLRLAAPVIVGQVGVMLMSLVDTAVVGRLGHVAMGAVGVAGALAGLAFLTGLGLLMGLDRVASVAWGAGRRDELARALVQGLYLALAVSLPLTVALRVVADHLGALGIDPSLVPDGRAYLRAVSWSILPALLFTAARSTLQATGDTLAATAILLVANVVNLVANVAFVFGRWGAPALGAPGSGYATVCARWFMALAMLAWAASRGLGVRRVGMRPHAAMLRELAALGGPAGVQLLFEGGIFSLVALLLAGLGAVPAAANQIVLQVSSLTFMVPLGFSVAGAVRVGHAMGREDPLGARRAGWAAISLGVGFMALSGVGLIVARGAIARVFTDDPAVIDLGRRLLVCAAVFQLFDGAQVTLSGALRGLGDTVRSMVANLVGHWGIGLPVGWALTFAWGFGAIGMWVGLAVGLAAVSLGLLRAWVRGVSARG